MFKAIVRFHKKEIICRTYYTYFPFIQGHICNVDSADCCVPDITNNQVQIVTVSPTLAPQEVEQLITMPIEIAISNIMKNAKIFVW